MEILHVNVFVSISVLLLLPVVYTLSTVAISETGNRTLICAIGSSSSPIHCRSFPERLQISIVSPFRSVSGIVGGNGFVCALSSFSRTSVMVCWRFRSIGDGMTYTRVYQGPVLKELQSGNSRICGLLRNSSSLRCWQWRGFNHSAAGFHTNLAVGDDFVCGLSNTSKVHCSGSDNSVTQFVPSGDFISLTAGPRYACAVSFNGSLYCWGEMAGAPPAGEFTALALGESRGCALRSNFTVSCWGEDEYSFPVWLNNESFIAIEGKRDIFCGIKLSNYSLRCWGNKEMDSNSIVFDDILPGPCKPRNECLCGPLPNYGDYCSQELAICLPCSSPPSSPSSPNLPPSSSSISNTTWNGRNVALLVVGCVGSVAFILALSLTLIKYNKSKGSSRIHDSGPLENDRALKKKLSHLISEGDKVHLEEFNLQLLSELTDNFSEDHKIGTGSFGSVYHAILEDGRQVAIKRAENSTASSTGTTKHNKEYKDSAFLNELGFLSRLNHKNLVSLVGYCEDGNELVLVYEYMSNGTLFHHLHKLESSPLMSWPRRIKVALDAARGIEYLHEFAMPRVIHRDIKSSNILLDSTWTAKVSDFGLSLLGPPDSDSYLISQAAGTMGYMDPEYYRLQVLTAKSDVYSFGVLLLELLSGRKAIHKNENGVPRNVVDHVVPYIIHDEIHRALDRRVPPPTPFEIEAVAFVGYLAADCVKPESIDRPTMTEVVNSLKRALEACLRSPALSDSDTDSSGIIFVN